MMNNPQMTIDETLDLVDWETITVSNAAAIGLTTSKLTRRRRGVILQAQDGTMVYRHDPLAANLSATVASGDYGFELTDGSFLIVRGTNNLTRLRMRAVTTDVAVRVGYF